MQNQDSGFLIQVLSRKINQYFSNIGKNLNISGTEIVILNYFFDTCRSQIYQNDIEKDFNIRSSTTTANIKLMINKNLLTSIIDPTDKRRKILKPTKIALELQQQLAGAKLELEQIIGSEMTVEDKHMLVLLLQKAIFNLEHYEEKGRK